MFNVFVHLLLVGLRIKAVQLLKVKILRISICCPCLNVFSFIFLLTDAECNGSTSSRPLLRPSLIGSGAGGVSTPSNHNSILKPASLGNPFAKAADVSDESPVSNHRSGEADAKPTPSGFLMPSRLNHVAKHPDSSSAPPAAGEEGGCSSPQPAESTPAAGTSLAALAKPTMPSVATNSNPFSVASASIGFVFGQKLHERVTVNLNTTGPPGGTCDNLIIQSRNLAQTRHR